MPPVRRHLNAGAVWAYSLGDLADVRARHAVTGAPTIVRSPWSGRAMRFDGANDYVTLTAQEYPLRFDAGTQDFSVVAWVRITAQGDMTIIDKRDGADDGWLLYTWIDGGDCGAGFSIDPDFAYNTDNLLVTDQWHCIAATIDRSTLITVYVDGVPGTNTVDPAGEVMATTTAPRIGAQSFDAAAKFSGDIDAIAVWDRILSLAEVQQLAGVA